jgi:hypothetical protein
MPNVVTISDYMSCLLFYRLLQFNYSSLIRNKRKVDKKTIAAAR